MSTPSSGADEELAPSPSDGDEAVSRWLVRLFLVLAFGLAFGIEGMTLIRSFVLDDEEETEQRAPYDGEEPFDKEREGAEQGARPLGVGDDLLPTTAVSERVVQMRIHAQSGGAWTFRFVVEVRNEGDGRYRLALRSLNMDDGTVLDDVHSVECRPGESARLVATWPVGPNKRPRTLTAVAKVEVSGDSIRTARRHVSFGHVPVQMQR